MNHPDQMGDEERDGFYFVSFEVQMPLHDHANRDPGNEFVQAFKGKIVFLSSHDSEEGVGDVTAISSKRPGY